MLHAPFTSATWAPYGKKIPEPAICHEADTGGGLPL
jgi:hypothetical protein